MKIIKKAGRPYKVFAFSYEDLAKVTGKSISAMKMDLKRGKFSENLDSLLDYVAWCRLDNKINKKKP